MIQAMYKSYLQNINPRLQPWECGNDRL